MIETGIFFDNIHSFHDLNLILSHSEIPPAKPKTNYIDIPGADGSVDMTQAHGEVKYSDREGVKFTFTMNPSGGLSESAWELKKTEISNLLNGKQCKITLDKDPDFYWIGRVTVDSYLSDKRLRQFVITARVRPYKFKQEETVVSCDLTENLGTVRITNARKSVSPVIECTDNNTVIVFNGYTFNLNAGTHKILEIRFVEGVNLLQVSGSGTITFKYQEGEL